LGGGICNKSLQSFPPSATTTKKQENKRKEKRAVFSRQDTENQNTLRFIIIMKVNYIHVVALNVNLYVFTSLDVENINYKNTVYLELS